MWWLKSLSKKLFPEFRIYFIFFLFSFLDKLKLVACNNELMQWLSWTPAHSSSSSIFSFPLYFLGSKGSAGEPIRPPSSPSSRPGETIWSSSVQTIQKTRRRQAVATVVLKGQQCCPGHLCPPANHGPLPPLQRPPTWEWAAARQRRPFLASHRDSTVAAPTLRRHGRRGSRWHHSWAETIVLHIRSDSRDASHSLFSVFSKCI